MGEIGTQNALSPQTVPLLPDHKMPASRFAEGMAKLLKASTLIPSRATVHFEYLLTELCVCRLLHQCPLLGVAETRRNIVAVTTHMSRYVETETLRRRPKQRCHRRSSSRWSGADENEYRRLLDALSRVSDAELECLEHKAERQDRAIEAMQCKYRINVPRPFRPLR